MPENLALYMLLVVAVAAGFLLGRRDRSRKRQDLRPVTRDYFKGLNHLLNERHDLAIDTFVESMAVDNDTVATHLALGSLVRRRGEVDRAIRIHQNLLARSVLSAPQRQQTELELARDYLVAGLLDRAENLLLELIARSGEHKHSAQELLLEIYQREKEWAKAVAVGRTLARQDRELRGRLAHFECELALQHSASGDDRAAHAALSNAARLDSQCARVPLLVAQLEMASKRYRNVRKHLDKAAQLDADLIPELLPVYRECCEKLEREDQYREFLLECLQRAPSLPVVEALTELTERSDGIQAAFEFQLQTLAQHPSVGGFASLLSRLQRMERPLQPSEIAPMLKFSRALLERQPLYRCRHCGFGSRMLMWQCPSCRDWGVLKPVPAQDLA
jgi:lipopolysaccharide biosynthesis regulator YciM